MDPVLNPYSPGAGMPPPGLAGRDDLLKTISIAIQRVKRVPAKSVILTHLECP
jgi:hypothetical protein